MILLKLKIRSSFMKVLDSLGPHCEAPLQAETTHTYYKYALNCGTKVSLCVVIPGKKYSEGTVSCSLAGCDRSLFILCLLWHISQENYAKCLRAGPISFRLANEMGADYCAVCRRTTFVGKRHIYGKSHQGRLRVVLLKFLEKVCLNVLTVCFRFSMYRICVVYPFSICICAIGYPIE